MKKASKGKQGFTLVELMMSMTILGMVMAGSTGVWLAFQRGWNSMSISFTSSNSASNLVEEMVYGKRRGNDFTSTWNLRSAEFDSVTFTSWENGSWRIWYNEPDRMVGAVLTPGYRTKLEYQAGQDRLINRGRVIADNVTASTAVIDTVNRGLRLSITLEDQRGGKSQEHTYETYVRFRN